MLKDFFSSEKAVASGVLVVVSAIFVVLGKLPIKDWLDYSQVLLGIYVGGKTVQGSVAALAAAKANEVRDHRDPAKTTQVINVKPRLPEGK